MARFTLRRNLTEPPAPTFEDRAAARKARHAGTEQWSRLRHRNLVVGDRIRLSGMDGEYVYSGTEQDEDGEVRYMATDLQYVRNFSIGDREVSIPTSIWMVRLSAAIGLGTRVLADPDNVPRGHMGIRASLLALQDEFRLPHDRTAYTVEAIGREFLVASAPHSLLRDLLRVNLTDTVYVGEQYLARRRARTL